MKFKKLPVTDPEILEGRKPLPEEASYLMDKYKGTYKYVNPYVLTEDKKYKLPPKVIESPSYEMLKPYELEGRRAAAALKGIFDIDPATNKGTLKEGVSPEKAKQYYEIIKENTIKSSKSVDKPSSMPMEMAGIETVGDPNFSNISMEFNPSTGTMRKVYTQTNEGKSLSEIINLEQDFFELEDKYKEKNLEMPLEDKKKLQKKIVDKYREHYKKFGDRI